MSVVFAFEPATDQGNNASQTSKPADGVANAESQSSAWPVGQLIGGQKAECAERSDGQQEQAENNTNGTSHWIPIHSEMRQQRNHCF